MDDLDPRRDLVPADGLIAAALAGLLFCVFVLTASLTFISDDELYIFDATESLARHTSTALSETADLNWPGEAQVEPMMPLLAAPIYWLANQFEGIGNVHATLLFNALLTALCGALVYFYARRLGYERQTALVGGLAFGLATIAWPYTKTYFRETLHMATLFATAYSLLSFRIAFARHSRSAWGWLIASVILAVVSLFAKESALYGLPVLLLIFVPAIPDLRQDRRAWLRIGLALVATVVIALIALTISGYYFGGGRFEVLARLGQIQENLVVAQQGIVGFLFSPGKSLFLFSPPLLLALAAPFVGERSRRFDASWPLILLAVSVVIYALVRGGLWWGGTNWGPRYMVPMTPFLILGALPVIELALRSQNILAKVGLALLILAGMAVQIGAVSVDLRDYYDAIAPVQPGAPWTIGLWDPYYSAITTHWRLMFNKPPDFAWVQALTTGPAWAVPMVNITLVIVFGVALWYGLKTESLKRRAVLGAALGGLLVTGVATWMSLHAIFYDRRYQGDNESLHQLNAALTEASSTAPDPVIFLNNRTYLNFMLNYYKGPYWVYTLELNPNELLQPGQSLPDPAIDPRSLVPDNIHSVVMCFGRKQPAYDQLCSAREHATLFLVMEFGPFTPQSPRPLEWWMSRNFFYRGVYEFGPIVRLVEFSTSSMAPTPSDPPAHITDYRLGDTIRLAGWDSNPDSDTLRPGAVINISTQWEAVTVPDADYKIGTYLMSPEGSIAAQDDSFPVNGFWPTLTWKAGELVRHNTALYLPTDLTPGFYEVWTLLYSSADGSRLPVQDASNTTIQDHIVLFTVEVTR